MEMCKSEAEKKAGAYERPEEETGTQCCIRNSYELTCGFLKPQIDIYEDKVTSAGMLQSQARHNECASFAE